MLHFRQVFEELVSEGSDGTAADPYPADDDQDVRARENR